MESSELCQNGHRSFPNTELGQNRGQVSSSLYEGRSNRFGDTITYSMLSPMLPCLAGALTSDNPYKVCVHVEMGGGIIIVFKKHTNIGVQVDNEVLVS